MAETIDVRRLPRLLWIATLLYWVLLSVLTHVPLDRYIPEEKKKLLHLLDKPEHVIAYFILTTLLGCSLVATFRDRRRLVWLAVPVALFLGAVDEWTQTWVNRTCSLNDWFANAVGILIGMIPVLAFRRSLARREAEAPTSSPGDPHRRTR